MVRIERLSRRRAGDPAGARGRAPPGRIAAGGRQRHRAATRCARPCARPWPATSCRRRRRPLPLPPRPAARGGPRRPAARRARRAAPRARPRAGAPREAQGDGARARGRRSPTTTSSPATSRAAFAAAVSAADAADARPRPRRGGGAATSARCELWERVPDAERLAGTDRVDAAVPGPPERIATSPARRGALRGRAERDRRDRRAHRAADLLESLARRAGGWAPRNAPGHARARAGAAAGGRRAAPSARCCSGCGAKFLMLRGRYADAVEAGASGAGRGRGAGEPARAQPRAQRAWARRSWPSATSTAARGKLREALELARRADDACREMPAAYVNLADAPAPARPLREGRASPHEGAERSDRHRRRRSVGEHGRGRDRPRHRRLGLRRAPSRPSAGPVTGTTS